MLMEAPLAGAGAGPRSKLGELSVLRPPEWLMSAYQRVTLISHCCHLEKIDIANKQTLIVCTDWLAWRKLVDQGAHALHFESALETWPEKFAAPTEVYLKSINWMFDPAGRDLSLFQGVSMGRQFTQDVALFSKAAERLIVGLDRIIKQYKPKEICLIDIQTEHRLLDDGMKRQIVDLVAQPADIEVVDNLLAPDLDDPLWPHLALAHIGGPSETGLRPNLRNLYSWAVDLLFTISRPRKGNRRRVLLLNNWQTISPLIDAFDGSRLTPVLLASQWPKSVSFIWRCWKKGIHLAHLPRSRLSETEVEAISRMPVRIRAAWTDDVELMERLRKAFVEDRIFKRNWLQVRAPMIKSYRQFFKCQDIDFVVVGDAGNALNRIVLEIAKNVGAGTAELPNGMLMTDQKLDVRTGRPHGGDVVDKFFAWGEQHEAWLLATGATSQCVRTGYPGIDAITANNKPVVRDARRILVLGCWVDGYDVCGLHSTKISYTLEIISRLLEAGYDQIRLKLHPGPPLLSYYQDAVAHHNLSVEIHKHSPLKRHLDWADAVIGPISSGSFVETLATGKPYYPIRHYPSGMSRLYTDRLAAFDTPYDAVEALRNGVVPDGQSALDYLCDGNRESSASTKVWRAIEIHANAVNKTNSLGEIQSYLK